MTVIRATKSQRDDGQVIDTWGTVKTIWVHLAETDGGKTANIEGLVSERTFIGEMVTDAGLALTQKDRLRLGSRTFEILSVINIEERGRVTRLGLKETI